MASSKLRVIPLGGVSEVGKNMMVVEYEDDILIIDSGLMFPEEEMLGVDLVIPDITYLMEHKEKVKAIIITHGHEDHIGALPFVLSQLNVPVYSTRLTNGLIQVRLKDRKTLARADLRIARPAEPFSLGKLRVEFFSVCHSIPDSAGLIIQTPVGTIVHSGDFKLDYTPVGGPPTDLSRLAQVGRQGVLLLLSDSTYAELPGYTPSERVVGEALDHIIADAPGRVIVTTFSSLLSRIQQVIDAAAKYQRRVFIVGRAMSDTTHIALNLGYLKAPEGILGQLDEAKKLPHNKVVFVTTGSQGEPTSALVRIANRDHPQLHVVPGDTVILSASAIPGNESLVNRTINSLFRQGAKVLYDKLAQVHVHGHGSQEELKLLINLVKPKFFMPIHGEYRHLRLHANIAESLGIPPENTFVMEDGDILELGPRSARKAGKTSAGNVYVDGLGVGDIGNVVLRDRRMLSRDGIVIVIVTIDGQSGKVIGRPEIVSRGFVETKDAGVIEESRDVVVRGLDHSGRRSIDLGFINAKVRDLLTRFYYDQTKRRPMVLPFVVKV